jgi:hypothetical protein
MSDIVTGTVTGQVDLSQVLRGQADIRREVGQDSGDIRREQAKEASDTRTEVVSNVDRALAQDTAYFIAGQSQSFSNATALAALTATTNSNFNQTLAAIQLAASQASAATQLGQAMIGQQIVADGNATRALINAQTIDELRFKNLKQDRCCDSGHRKPDPVLNFGPPLTANVAV